MQKRKFPVGIEFYKEMIEKKYYYVDKTLLIKDILDSGAKVSLFTRPRRFGKTLALQMLKAFFEDERDKGGAPIDNSHYFSGKKILACGGGYREEMGRYPVISLTLKSAKQPNFEMAYALLKDAIEHEFSGHLYVYESGALPEKARKKYKQIWMGEGSPSDYATALAFLSECLYAYHGRKAVILIDEYDVPLENAYFRHFYDEMVGFVRSLFESSLKTNKYLERAVVTGCLRISRESIFTGLNNLEAVSILNETYGEHFGFTQEEVRGMLADYGLEGLLGEAEKWYNGYLFGRTQVYNPWSVINYVKSKTYNREAFPRPYWSNTSSNGIVRELVEGADYDARGEIEELIAGGTIEKRIHEDITYGDIHESQDSLWNFLFFTGYLKKVGERQEGRDIYLKMAIPNDELISVYENTVLLWFEKKVKASDLSPLLAAVEGRDCAAFGRILSEQLLDTISFYDYAENYYHGFLIGLLKGLLKGDVRYYLRSNREGGTGRPDIIMKYPIPSGAAYIMELKVAKGYAQMEAGCDEALAQAERGDYKGELLREGYTDVTVFGICFCKKGCMVKKAD